MPTGTLSGKGKALWEKVYNDSKSSGDSEERAAKKAWAAVKDAGWHKNKDGAWVKDSMYQEFSLFVSRASFETNEPDPNKRMRFRMSSSDIEADLAGERMSLELFNNFKRRIDDKDIPEPFKSVICEEDWCGGMPYLSVAHYKSGTNKKNVPGYIDDVYIDGHILKAKGGCYDTSLGRATFNALLDDQTKRKNNVEDFDPVRVSIGFLDLKHKHAPEGGQEYFFTRTAVGQICPLCAEGIGDKIYLDGVLVHKALTRVPMNPRTDTSPELEQKSMDDITTRKQDARSIVGALADTLDMDEVQEKSNVLVIKSDGTGTEPTSYTQPFSACYDPNVDLFDQNCVNATMRKFMDDIRNQMHTVKSGVSDEVINDAVEDYLKSIGRSLPVVEESMAEKVETPVVEKKMDEEHKEEMEKEHEAEEKKEEKSALDARFEALKSVLAGKPTAEQVQAAFNELGVEVEKSYTPPTPNPADMIEQFKSILEQTIAPLKVQIAALQAQSNAGAVTKSEVPVARSLLLKPDPLQGVNANQRGPHGRPIVNGQELSQLQYIAMKSTGAIKE